MSLLVSCGGGADKWTKLAMPAASDAFYELMTSYAAIGVIPRSPAYGWRYVHCIISVTREVESVGITGGRQHYPTEKGIGKNAWKDTVGNRVS